MAPLAPPGVAVGRPIIAPDWLPLPPLPALSFSAISVATADPSPCNSVVSAAICSTVCVERHAGQEKAHRQQQQRQPIAGERPGAQIEPLAGQLQPAQQARGLRQEGQQDGDQRPYGRQSHPP